MDDVPTYSRRLASDRHDGTTRRAKCRRWLRILIGMVIAALVVAYVVYMSLGMPGMDHSQHTPAPHGVAGTPVQLADIASAVR